MRIFSYRQYLLGIRSEFPLPDVSEEGREADVEIRMSQTFAAPLESDCRYQVEVRPQVSYHCWPPVGCFSVEHGRQILVRPTIGVDPRLLGHFIARIAFASILQQRKFLVLHASAVAVDGNAIAILGGSGAGKSALAAALHLVGCHVLADDVLAIEEQNGVPYVLPASHRLHLWPRVAAALGFGESLHRVVNAEAKLVIPSWSACPPKPMPLCLIVHVAHGETLGMSSLSPSVAFRQMAGSSFIDHIASDRIETAAFICACRRIASKVRSVRLTRRDVDVGLQIRNLADRVLTNLHTAEIGETPKAV
jgi:hypothetical protein